MEAKQPISQEALDVLTAFIRAMTRQEALMLINDLDTHTLRIRLQGVSPKYVRILDEQPISAIVEGWHGNLELRMDDCDRPLHVWTANELEQYAQDAADSTELGAVGEALATSYLSDIEDFYHGEGAYIGTAEIRTCVGCRSKNQTDWFECQECQAPIIVCKKCRESGRVLRCRSQRCVDA